MNWIFLYRSLTEIQPSELSHREKSDMEKQGDIYVRYSPVRDRDQISTIEAQVAMCREKAGS